MLALHPLEKHHLISCQIQPQQYHYRHTIIAYDCMRLAPYAWSVLHPKTRHVIACAGVITQDVHRGYVWAILSVHAGAYLRTLLSITRQLLHDLPFTRYEALVDTAFEAGHRLIQLLDFQKEGTLHHFWPQGGDVTLYGTIKKGASL